MPGPLQAKIYIIQISCRVDLIHNVTGVICNWPLSLMLDYLSNDDDFSES